MKVLAEDKKEVEDNITDNLEQEEPDVDPSNPATIPKFLDELPIPPILKPKKRVYGSDFYEVEMKKTMHQFHECFCPTEVWGYEGMCPGPTIEVMKDETIHVRWVNNLPKKHLLTVDKTLHSAIDSPEVRTTVHLHGANVEWESDGHPDSWYTRDYDLTGSKFVKTVYEYTNHQQATTLWYHDHAIGLTRLNVYAGLAGFYIIRDTLEPTLELPCGKYEIPIMIQDKSFNNDASLFYPPTITPGFAGNTAVVNGKVWPKLTVEARKYRFRLLNASNRRFYTLRLSNGQSFYQIGTDGGLLSKPVLINSVTIAPSERADIIIDFTGLEGEIILENADTTNPATPLLPEIMKFKVIPLKHPDKSKIPETLHPVRVLEEKFAEPTQRDIIIDAIFENNQLIFRLEQRMFEDPVVVKPELGTIEIWNLINQAGVIHPIHVHLVQFQILDFRPFTIVNGKIEYGVPYKPDENERGWKDTVKVPPRTAARIIAQFEDYKGNYVFHCHILEHEDHDMMRPYTVI
jgi:spore coat protein A